MQQPSLEEAEKAVAQYRIDALIKAREICKDCDEIFLKLFELEVGMAGSVMSTTSTAAHAIERTQQVRDVWSECRRHEWRNSKLPSILPDLVKIFNRLYTSPRDPQYAHPMEWEMVACLAVISKFLETPICRETVEKVASETMPFQGIGDTTEQALYQPPYYSMIQGCARQFLIDRTTQKLNKALQRVGNPMWHQTGRDGPVMVTPEERERGIRLYAHWLWVHEGKPEGKALEHWQKAEDKIDDLILLCGSISDFCNLYLDEDTRRLWDSF